MAAECDFFVIDTDSLAPFALGADGEDPVLAELIRKNPEPVLELIGKAVRAMRASGKGKSVGVAGYLAADTSLTERLLSLGVDFLSVHSPGILELRERIRNCP